jgi:hypothetical protein
MDEMNTPAHSIKLNMLGLVKMGFIFITCISLLSACAAPELQTVEVTRIVPQTVEVTRVVELVVTATPKPTSPTQPSAAAPSGFVVWDVQQVLDAFLAVGLEATDSRPMISDDYGLVPMLALDGIRFFIPSICSDCGGRIMSFADAEKLQIVRDYYGQMGRFSAILFSWVFVKENILVQLNGALPEADARKYEAALSSLQ